MMAVRVFRSPRSEFDRPRFAIKCVENNDVSFSIISITNARGNDGDRTMDAPFKQ